MTDLTPHYLSTACHHDLHERCREVCKFCDEACVCDCHVTPALEPDND